ncbi:MAG: alpha/beta hydrolase [Flavobacteriales bacterium]
MKRLKYLPFAMLFVLALLFHFGASSLLIHPIQRSPDTSEVQRIIDQESAKFSPLSIQSGKVKLSGYFAVQEKTNDKTVVILHGVGGVSTDLKKELSLFLDAGYNVAALDARAHGNSEGGFCTYGYHEVSDYSMLLNELEKKFGQKKFAIYGHSMGAAVAVQCAASDDRFKALLAFAPFKNLEDVSLEYMDRLFGFRSTFLNTWMLWAAECRADFNSEDVSPEESAKKVNCPTLIAHGLKDVHIPLSHAEAIHKQIKHPSKYFVPIEEANHVSLWSNGGRQLEVQVLNLLQEGWE